MARGFIVASLDYRNFPQGTVGDMIQDVGAGIGWVSRRAASLGGDPSRVFVVGQSAGAHLAATAMLRQSEWERGDLRRGSSPWSPKSLAGFVGISGVYAPDDGKLVEHFNTKGLYREVFYSIMEAGFSGSRAEEALPRASPCAILREQSTTPGLVAEQPPVLLCHGSADTSAPPSQSADYAAALRSAGAREVTERYYSERRTRIPLSPIPSSAEGTNFSRISWRSCGARGAVRDGKVSGDACAASEAARRHRQDHGAVLGGSVRRRGRVLVGRRAARFLATRRTRSFVHSLLAVA